MNDPSVGNAVSLITVFGGLDVPLDPRQPVSEQAAIPLEWAIVTVWRQLAEDAGHLFEERILVTEPNGTIFAEITQPLPMTEFTATNTVRIPVFPVGIEGMITITVEIREHTDDGHNEWTFVQDYPIRLRHLRVADSQ